MPILTAYTKADYDRHYGSGYWKDETFTKALDDAAARTPERVALVHGESRVTYAKLRDRVEAFASGLSDAGVRREDVVSVQLPNTIELAVVILAIARLGAVYNPLNPGYRRREVRSIVELVRPAAVVCPAEYRGFDYPALLDEAAANVDSIQLRVAVGRAPHEAWTPFDDVVARGRASRQDARSLPPPDPDAVFLLGATSGTTGQPKVYIHTANTQLQEARRLNAFLGLGEADVFLAMAPMTHRGALMFGFCTSVAAAATVVLADSFDADQVLDRFEKERVSAFMAIPTQVVDLLKAYESRPRGVASVRVAILAGAPVAEQLVERFFELWPDCTPITGYGMSECGYCTLTSPDAPRDKLFTSGAPALGMSIEIRDEDGREVPKGDVGEIHIRGPFVCAGYFDNQTATRRAIDRDGWLASGDLGFVDDDGYLHPVGRIKHVIIRGGLKVHAEEIEFLLGQHPAVGAAVVVGVPDPRLGERGCACIVPRDGRRFDLAEARRFLEDRGVAKFQWPEFIEIFDEFPRNPVGKIDRRAIAAEAAGRVRTS